MADILKNRDKTELKQILEKFLGTLKEQHGIEIEPTAVTAVVITELNSKIFTLLKSRLEDFSIQELMKIREIYNPEPVPSVTSHIPTKKSRGRPKRSKADKLDLQ